MVRWSVIALALGLAGCGTSIEKVLDIQEVDMPVVMRVAPPVELTAPLPTPSFRFIAPVDPKAVAALDKDGAAAFVAWGDEMRRRLEAWAAWAGLDRLGTGG